MFNIKKAAIILMAVVLLASLFAFTISAASITTIPYGDANKNGEVDICDLVRIKEYIENDATVISISAADYDNDNSVDEEDLAHLRKVLLGLADYDDTIPTGYAEWNSSWNS